MIVTARFPILPIRSAAGRTMFESILGPAGPTARKAILALACCAALALSGCGSSHPSLKAGPPNGIITTRKEALYIPLPKVANPAESLLARAGWGEGRLPEELRKELLYQFKRKGVPVVEDSTQSASRMNVFLSEYDPGEGGASRYVVSALLKTPGGERRLEYRNKPRWVDAPEREDPTLDNIRKMAKELVELSRKDPDARKDPLEGGDMGLMMIF
jgi:hypothetical protein